MPTESADVVIIGGGIVGAAIARELSRYELAVVLVEAETDVAMGPVCYSYYESLRYPLCNLSTRGYLFCLLRQ